MPSAELLLDTHAWIVATLDPDKLETKAQKQIVRAARENRLLLSSISVWEVMMLATAGKLKLKPTPADWVRDAVKKTNVLIVPVDFDIAFDAGRQSGMHGDPADRIIFVTAAQRAATLMTADEAILKHAKSAKMSIIEPW